MDVKIFSPHSQRRGEQNLGVQSRAFNPRVSQERRSFLDRAPRCLRAVNPGICHLSLLRVHVQFQFYAIA